MFSEFLTLINYIFSMQVQLSNGERKQLFLQQKIMPYVSGFPVVCSAVITSYELTVITTA
jgi:hypothetical protein